MKDKATLTIRLTLPTRDRIKSQSQLMKRSISAQVEFICENFLSLGDAHIKPTEVPQKKSNINKNECISKK